MIDSDSKNRGFVIRKCRIQGLRKNESSVSWISLENIACLSETTSRIPCNYIKYE